MGVNISHNAYDGPCSTFNDFRRAVMKAYNGTTLDDYDYWGDTHSLHLSSIKDKGIYALMRHSDNSGIIGWQNCKRIADALHPLIPKIDHFFYKEIAINFMAGCLRAYDKKEKLKFT